MQPFILQRKHLKKSAAVRILLTLWCTIYASKLKCSEACYNYTDIFLLQWKATLEVTVLSIFPWLFFCRTSSEIDDKAVQEFVDEDAFLISLDYDAEKGVCSVVLETSWRRKLGYVSQFSPVQRTVFKLYLCPISFRSTVCKVFWKNIYKYIYMWQLGCVRLIVFWNKNTWNCN